MDLLTVLLIVLVSCVACAVAGASVAKEKGREPLEGVIYGALFGPIGIVVTALLPTKQLASGGQSNSASNGGRDKVRSLDDRGQIAYLENRYRDILDEVAPDWPKTSYHRRKAILRNYDKKLMKEIKLTPTQFDELSV